MFLFFSICACKCAILMYSFQSYQFFFSLLFASSLSAFLFIYFLLFVQCRFFFIFFCLLAILCAYIYKYKYLFVPCLHSRMIFCVPEKLVFLITDFVQCSFHICLCAVSFISFSFFFLPFFIYQSHRQNDDNDENY